jgi:hypothetical protein
MAEPALAFARTSVGTFSWIKSASSQLTQIQQRA